MSLCYVPACTCVEVLCINFMQLSASEPIELSRIYPTPPSVENTEGEKFDDVKMTRVDRSECEVTGLLWDSVSTSANT